MENRAHTARYIKCTSIAADFVVNEYNLRLEKLANEYKNIDVMNFGVSYQPGFKQFPVAKYKQAFFSGVDWYVVNMCNSC